MKWDTKQMAGRAASVATIWGVSKLLSSKPGKKAARRVDARMQDAGRTATRSLRKGARNAWSNRAWTTAGLTLVAMGAAILGRAATKR